MRATIVILASVLGLFAAVGAAAQDRPRGLLWRDSPLPAVFPLQILSAPGEDYYLQLVEIETGEAVLAAYVRGGAQFRVLVPPGTFRLRFAAGRDWQGEERLFGQGSTRLFELPEPLQFGVRDFRTKGGHRVDLRRLGGGEMAGVTPFGLCQALFAADTGPAVTPALPEREAVGVRVPDRVRIEVRAVPCRGPNRKGPPGGAALRRGG